MLSSARSLMVQKTLRDFAVSRVEDAVTETKIMKSTILIAMLLGAVPFVTLAADDAKPAQKPKPYTLKTCVVSGEEINDKGDMKPHVFTYEGREIKLCCKSCLKDFNKEPAKFVKKIEEAEKAPKK